ncbi:hypothetical protein JAAARDRAFT_200214 [Jaapia argillacea MUCL 33604]|uniref:Uncharacterized protein n=1 Tax=Jaapia argillacea MUCL 33604 TaxID=933084 RepID=A0A067PI13_9AGAM|nr:hypothetical protein JAAARDRAFT_200214 [Jaapia argillacea MUCL 33604]
MFDNFVEEITQQLGDEEAQQLREEVWLVDGVEVPTARAMIDKTGKQSQNKKLGDWKGKHPVPGSLGHLPRAGDVVTPVAARAVMFNPVLSTPVGRLGLHYDPNITALVSRLAEARQSGESVVDYKRRMNSLRQFSESTSQIGTNSVPTTPRRQHIQFKETKVKGRHMKDSSQNNRPRTEAGGGGGQGGGPPDRGSSHSSDSSSTPLHSDNEGTQESRGGQGGQGGGEPLGRDPPDGGDDDDDDSSNSSDSNDEGEPGGISTTPRRRSDKDNMGRRHSNSTYRGANSRELANPNCIDYNDESLKRICRII